MKSRLGSIFSGSVGNLIEWYDFYVYSFFSLYFAKAFFPGSDPTAQLLNTALIFALGFFMRPLGGWLMGAYADRQGRRAALMLSVLMTLTAGSANLLALASAKIFCTSAPVTTPGLTTSKSFCDI